jgi:hypothetical protein
MTNKELAEALKEWFKHNQSNRNLWNDNILGITLRDEMEKRGNWQSKPRGNPRKGQRIMIANKEAKGQSRFERDYSGD